MKILSHEWQGDLIYRPKNGIIHIVFAGAWGKIAPIVLADARYNRFVFSPTEGKLQMLPQVIDAERGVFRQYQVNGVLTIGISDGVVHEGFLVVDPYFQKRYFKFLVNGFLCPDSITYLEAFRQPVKTPLNIGPDMVRGLYQPFDRSPEGFIIIEMYKRDAEEDLPVPAHGQGGLQQTITDSIKLAPAADKVPLHLTLTDTYYIKLAWWDELQHVAEPSTERKGWGPPLTTEDTQVNQFWSLERVG